MISPLSLNSNHIVVTVSIDFPSNPMPFSSYSFYNYSHADWDSLRDHLRDVPWEDILVPQLLVLNFLSGSRLKLMDRKFSQEDSVNAGVSQDFILGSTLCLLYINYLPNVICNIVVLTDDSTLDLSSMIRHLICDNNWSWLLNLNLTLWHKILWTCIGGLLISMLEKLILFHLYGLITLVLLMWKKDGFVLEEKSFFKMTGLLHFLYCWNCLQES